MIYHSTKTYGHERGFSCAFRQYGAKSHCAKIHGYAISIHLDFAAFQLDDNNWVIDFGALNEVEDKLRELFDHTLLVAEDDPFFERLAVLDDIKVARVIPVPATGCEAFAKLAWNIVDRWLTDHSHKPRVWLHKVEIKEHGANGAIYEHTPQGVAYERVGDVERTIFINQNS